VYYDVHLLPPDAADDPRAAIVRRAADDLAALHTDDPPVLDPTTLARVHETWVRPGEGLRIEDSHGTVTVRLPCWYVGKKARDQAKVLHAVVKDLERATGWRAFDPQLDDWFTGRSPKDTAAVLDAVADFQARERMDTPAVDARRAARESAGKPRPIFRRRS
jgi:hypothetical protein